MDESYDSGMDASFDDSSDLSSFDEGYSDLGGAEDVSSWMDDVPMEDDLPLETEDLSAEYDSFEADDISAMMDEVPEPDADISDFMEPPPEVYEETPEFTEDPAEIYAEAPEFTEEPDEVYAETPEFTEEPDEVFEETPETVEEAPEVFEETPEAVEESPEVFEETPEVTEEAPEVFEETPEVTEEAPEVFEETPETVEEAPEVFDEAPETVEETPEVFEETPEVTEEAPEVFEETPVTVEEAPEVFEETPEVTEEAPEVFEETPETVEESPEVFEETPETVEETPEVFEETPETIEEPGEVFEETPETIEETPEVFEETPETIEETPEVFEETPETVEKAPEVFEETPETIEETPEVFEETPEVTEEAPEVFEETPETIEETPEVFEETPEEPATPDMSDTSGPDVLLSDLTEGGALDTENEDLLPGQEEYLDEIMEQDQDTETLPDEIGGEVEPETEADAPTDLPGAEETAPDMLYPGPIPEDMELPPDAAPLDETEQPVSPAQPAADIPDGDVGDPADVPGNTPPPFGGGPTPPGGGPTPPGGDGPNPPWKGPDPPDVPPETEELGTPVLGFYSQGNNEFGFEGTCGPTSIANGANRVLGEALFTENDVLSEAIQSDLCDVVPGSPADSGGTTTSEFVEIYEHINALSGDRLNIETYDFDNVLTMEQVAQKLDEGCTIHAAVDADTLWGQSAAGMMGTPEIEKATDHWITVTDAVRDESGNVTGFKIIDSGGGVDYVDAETYETMCYGSDSLHLDDPTCVVVSRKDLPEETVQPPAADVPAADVPAADVPAAAPDLTPGADVSPQITREMEQLRETSPVFRELQPDRVAPEMQALGRMSDAEREIYYCAVEKEPEITRDVLSVGSAVGGKVEGLEHKIKLPESLEGKIHSETDPMDIENVHDILRYTHVFEPEQLADGANASLAAYEQQGYTIENIKNTWEDPNLPYKGINVKLLSPDGQPLEVQFHTQESFDLKNSEEMHGLYEIYRRLPEESVEAVEIQNQMFALSRQLKMPPRISEVHKR